MIVEFVHLLISVFKNYGDIFLEYVSYFHKCCSKLHMHFDNDTFKGNQFKECVLNLKYAEKERERVDLGLDSIILGRCTVWAVKKCFPTTYIRHIIKINPI